LLKFVNNCYSSTASRNEYISKSRSSIRSSLVLWQMKSMFQCWAYLRVRSSMWSSSSIHWKKPGIIKCTSCSARHQLPI
jgi:hypothetical protein